MLVITKRTGALTDRKRTEAAKDAVPTGRFY